MEYRGFNNAVIVLQGELTVCESTAVKLIGYDGNITQRKLGESSVHLNGVRGLNYTLFSVVFIPFTVYRTEQTACLPL